MTIAEFWKERYDAVVAEKQIIVEDRKELKMQLEVEKEENESLHNVIDSFVDKCKELEDKAEGYKKKLELLNTVVTPDLDAQLKSMTERLEKSIADRKELQADRDIWFRKNGEKQAEIEELKKKIQSLEAALEFKKTQLEGTKERLYKSIADRSELQADLDFWVRDSGEKLAEIQSLKNDLDDAKKQLDEIKQEFKQSYADGYSDGNEEGQNELWEMLQLINDVKPFEAPYFEDVTSMNDIISWDLEDFKEAYDKWEAEKKKAAEEAKKQHVEYMRGYLKRYCIGKLCFGCPLYDTSKPVTSCLFSKLTDEEIEKRYRKVIESERKVIAADNPCSGVREKVKEACDAFAEGLKAGLASEVKEVPVSCDIPIKDLESWECTIEAKVEINEDLLKDICGIKPKEEEHKLEYGDAVRLPWCNYDYMYIAPDEKEETLVRLFDPNIHAIVTTHISNVRYNGGRILVSEEDDIRKIWKYMK